MNKTIYTTIGISSVLMVVMVGMSSASFAGGSQNTFVTVSFLAAFVGGFLSLISPCSAAMLPVFFAYSFKQKNELLKMTLVFYLGLATIFVPLGFASSFISGWFITHPTLLYNLAGALFILFGSMLFLGKSFQILPERLRVIPKGTGAGTVYLMGLLFAFATGTCSAPIIGGIFTIAATTGNAANGILLLLTYALGMVGPLLIMAWFFDKYNFAGSKLIIGKSWPLKIGSNTYYVHSTNLIAAVLFILVGLLFIFSRGTNAFLGIFESFGLTDLYYSLNVRLLESTGTTSTLIFALIIVSIGLLVIRSRKLSKKEDTVRIKGTEKDSQLAKKNDV